MEGKTKMSIQIEIAEDVLNQIKNNYPDIFPLNNQLQKPFLEGFINQIMRNYFNKEREVD